jgi:hypothetical protein
MNSSAINDAGQVLFRAYLTGAGVNSDNDEGIWATDRSGVLQLIVREGDSLQVAPGDVREIEDLDFLAPSWDYGRPLGFNNKGEVAFSASFFPNGADGIFVTDIVATTNLLPGDFQVDGDVDGTDLILWKNRFGTGAGGDADGDGDTDGADFLVWQQGLGMSAASAASKAVPEPAAWMLALVGLALMRRPIRG